MSPPADTITATYTAGTGFADSNGTTTQTVTPLAITVTAAANTKTYDGTTSAAATPTITAGSLVRSDTAAFSETYDNKNAGTGKTLTPAGSVNDGNSGNNYAVTFVANTTAPITGAGDHGHGGHQHQDLRRHDHARAATPTITGRQPGHRRHGGLQRDLRHQERGHGQDAHGGRLRSTTATAAATTR